MDVHPSERTDAGDVELLLEVAARSPLLPPPYRRRGSSRLEAEPMAVERRRAPTPDGRSLEVLDSACADRDRVPVVFHLGTPTGIAALPAPLDPGARIRVVMYARPGYGRSTPQPGRSVADAARDTSSI